MIRLITSIFVGIFTNGILLYLISTYIPELGFEILGGDNIYISIAILGAVFRLFNSFIKKILKTISMPISFLTFGLSSIFINILIIYIFQYTINTSGLDVNIILGTFGQTLLLSIIISTTYFIIKKIL